MKPFVALLVMAALPLACWAQSSPTPAPATPETKPAPAAEPAKEKMPLPRIYLGGDSSKAKAAETKPATAPKSTATPGKGTVIKSSTQKTGKKDEPPAKIEGMEIARSDKGFLGLQVEGGNFKLAFYDAKKKPKTPDVVRAVLRWTPNYKPGTEVYVLGPSADGKFLTAAKTVRAPYNFKLFVSLFSAGVEEPTESFVVDFRQ